MIALDALMVRGYDAPIVQYLYPLVLDVTRRRIVIVGAGAVAARKAAGLLDAGARCIRCVALAFDPKFPLEVERLCAPYDSHHLEGAELVFAATDSPPVNEAVTRDARARGILVNRADASESPSGDFVTPAVMRRGAIAVTISAGSAALAAGIRDRLAQQWDDRWSLMAEVMQHLRPKILAHPQLDSAQRAVIFRELASEEALAALTTGGLPALLEWFGRHHPNMELSTG